MPEYYRLPIEDTLSGPAIQKLSEFIAEGLCVVNVTPKVRCELENLANLCESYLQHKVAGVWQEAPVIDDLLT